MIEYRCFLDKYYVLSDLDWLQITKKIVVRNFSKGVIILKKGKIEHYVSFVNKGIVRSVLHHKEKEKTVDFFFSNEYMCSWASFYKEEVSLYDFEAFNDVELFSISRNDIIEIEKQNSELIAVSKGIIGDFLLKKTEKIESLLFKTPEERYLEIYEKEPKLIQLIPLQYLASYIGISPQSLSRIRNRIFKG